jgi:hypothetical protein
MSSGITATIFPETLSVESENESAEQTDAEISTAPMTNTVMDNRDIFHPFCLIAWKGKQYHSMDESIIKKSNLRKPAQGRHRREPM